MNKTVVFTLITVAIMWYTLANTRPQPVFAMTAHGSDNKTIATVPLDGGMEAVITLDHATGDLTGYVLDQFTGKFFVQYRYNVTRDFGNGRHRYMLATGSADFRQITGNQRMANGVVYVSEEASGQIVAYGMPWNPQLRNNQLWLAAAFFVPLNYAMTRFAEEPRVGRLSCLSWYCKARHMETKAADQQDRFLVGRPRNIAVWTIENHRIRRTGQLPKHVVADDGRN
ncbi:MAG: hypothetical protein R3C28_00240 [Pirellulaceae bacterium]